MTTKNGLIRKYANGWVGGMTIGDEERVVYPAMDEYAKEVAIGFFKWNAEKVFEYVEWLKRGRFKQEQGEEYAKQCEITVFELSSVEGRFSEYLKTITDGI